MTECIFSLSHLFTHFEGYVIAKMEFIEIRKETLSWSMFSVHQAVYSPDPVLSVWQHQSFP